MDERRLALRDGVLQGAVDGGRRHAPGVRLVELLDAVEQAIEATAGDGRGGHDHRPLAELAFDAQAQVVQVDLGGVPFRDDDERGAARFARRVRDVEVVIHEALGAIDQDEGDVGVVGRGQRALLAPVLDVLPQRALAAHAGGIDESEHRLAAHETRVDRVAGGTGDVADDHPRRADQLVEERGLAHVRPAEDGDANLVGDALHALRRRQLGESLDDQVEQIAAAGAVDGGDGHGIAQPELVEDERSDVAALAVGLVGNENQRELLTAQDLGDLEVTGHHAGLGVDDEQRHVGLGEGRTCLGGDLVGHHRLPAEIDTAGIDEAEELAVPLDVDVLAVARDTGLGVDDRIAAARQAVAERGLAHVRVADDGDDAEQRLLRQRLGLLFELLASALARSRWLASAHALVSLVGHSGGTASFGRPARSALSANDCSWRRCAPRSSEAAR